jgi:cytochrome c553
MTRVVSLPILVLSGFVLTTACRENGPHAPVGNGGNKPVVNEQQLRAGFGAVKSIFAQHCVSCHPSRSAPDWLDVNQAIRYVGNGKLLNRVVIKKTMPPPKTPQAASMRSQDRDEIKKWIALGGPESPSPSENDNGSSATPLVTSCFGCHGSVPNDPSSQPKIPRLRGQNKNYIVMQLKHFKFGDRVDLNPSESMNEIAYPLTEEQMEEMANYFSAFKGPSYSEEPKLSAEETKLFQMGQQIAAQKCNSCHQNRENHDQPTDDLLPVLAGQSKQYLVNQIIEFRKNERPNKMMHRFAERLTNDDIEALATFFTFSP